jgi:hypothetical protein
MTSAAKATAVKVAVKKRKRKASPPAAVETLAITTP